VTLTFAVSNEIKAKNQDDYNCYMQQLLDFRQALLGQLLTVLASM